MESLKYNSLMDINAKHLKYISGWLKASINPPYGRYRLSFGRCDSPTPSKYGITPSKYGRYGYYCISFGTHIKVRKRSWRYKF